MKAYIACVMLPLAAVLTTAVCRPPADIAQSPPMGWNSWNWFGKKFINENVVREVVDAMVSTSLCNAGYYYIVVDGGWRDIRFGPRRQAPFAP